MTDRFSEDAVVAEQYYDSRDADRFYHAIWGGEDIHIGLYEGPADAIADASRRTVAHMIARLSDIGDDARVLDLGAGYGGAARQIVAARGWTVDCVNISETQNERNRVLNAEAGAEGSIRVLHGSFDSPPVVGGVYDVVWSQDAFLHGEDRAKIIQAAATALKPGGRLIFTDPMAKADAPADALQPIFDRIHLSSLGTIEFYRKAADEAGLDEVGVEEMADMLGKHYARVREELTQRRDSLADVVSTDYVDRMIAGLGHWVDGAEKGWLTWGVLDFKKRA